MPVSNLKCGCQHSESTHRHACASVYSLRVVQRSAAAASTPSVQLPPNLNQPGRQKAAPVSRVGRGAGALGARGTKKRRPRLGRGALQNFDRPCLRLRSRSLVRGACGWRPAAAGTLPTVSEDKNYYLHIVYLYIDARLACSRHQDGERHI